MISPKDRFYAPAVEGGPLEQDMENVIIRTQTDQYTGTKVIREDKENMDIEEEGEGRGKNPFPVNLPSREDEMRETSPEDPPYVGENEVEMKEQRREKLEKDKVERGRRKRRREEEHRVISLSLLVIYIERDS